MPSKRYRIKPKSFFYALIDGTLAGDSAEFGDQLEKHGTGSWANLLDFLPLASDQQFGIDAGRLAPGDLVPFMPIYQIHTKTGAPLRDRSKTIPVMMPNGFHGKGHDPFLKAWSEGDDADGKVAKKDWGGRTTYGRHTAIERSNRYLSHFFLHPEVEVTVKEDGSPAKGRIVTRPVHILPDPKRKQFFADLLYISSHGWLGGFAAGDRLQKMPSAQPAEARGRYFPRARYFVLGQLVAEKQGFLGPKWIVFALCSAACSATWPYWVQVFERSFPQVRGLLAYEESAPGGGSKIARSFLSRLSSGQTFLQAWKDVNKGKKWAAIVHRDAEQDTLLGWATQKPVQESETTATGGLYKGYLSSSPQGEPIRIVSPPFAVKLSRLYEGNHYEVLPENLSGFAAALCDKTQYQLEVSPGPANAGAKPLSASIRWVHVRDTYTPQISYRSIFQPPKPAAGVSAGVSDDKNATLLLESKGDAQTLGVTLTTRDEQAFKASHVHADHTYLWLRVELRLAGASQPLQHDFTLKGLLY